MLSADSYSRKIYVALLRALEHLDGGARRRSGLRLLGLRRFGRDRRAVLEDRARRGGHRPLLRLLALQRAGVGLRRGVLAAEERLLVNALGLLVVLVNRVAHDELELALGRGEREFLGLFGRDLQSHGLDLLRLSVVVLRLVNVLARREHLDVLEDDLRDRPLVVRPVVG